MGVWPICEWSIGISPLAAGFEGGDIASCCEWSIGIVIAGSVARVGFLCPVCAVAFAFFAAAFFAGLFVAVFLGRDFFATGFAGIGLVIPGMFWCCAAAGAGTAASAKALTVTVRRIFTK
jgi:hypothetical protein